MLKTIVKWLLVLGMAFSAGFVFRSLFKEGHKHDNRIVIGTEKLNPIAYRNEQDIQMDDQTRRMYHELVSEYLGQTMDDDSEKISFSDFIATKRDKLVQEGRYTVVYERMEKQVIEWYNRLNDINRIPGYEVNTYYVHGTVALNDKNLGLCGETDKTNVNILVAAYLEQPTDSLYPVVPRDSITPEPPLDYTIVDCSNGNFELSFVLGNRSGMESPPVYFAAYAFSSTTNNYLYPLAVGTDKRTSGVPPSLLSKRHTNKPALIRLRPVNSRSLRSNITLVTQKGALVSPHGLDNILALRPEMSVSRTTLAGTNGVARLKSMPMFSNIVLDIVDDKGSRTFFTIPSSSDGMEMNMDIPIGSSGSSLMLIPPANQKEGEMLLFSKTNANKASVRFNNQERKPVILERLQPVETFLELISDGKSQGLMPVKIMKDTLSVVEPNPKRINRIYGRATLSDSLEHDGRPCRSCTISIKYTDRVTNTDSNGNFALSDVSVIDNCAQLEIEHNGRKILYPMVVHNPINTLRLSLSVPSTNLLSGWNQIKPTLPGHGSVFGDYPSKSFHAFLSGIDVDHNEEALYFDEGSLPSKTSANTPYEASKTGFGKFLFLDLKPGEYVLYIMSSDRIIHTRKISIGADSLTLIN